MVWPREVNNFECELPSRRQREYEALLGVLGER